jgi:hypothetical protein
MIIDLTQENDTRAYNDTELIQQNAKNKILKRIDELLKLTVPDSPEDTKCISHNSILINGKRGYGKSTFMLSVKKYLNDKYKNELLVFDSIDPTIMEEKENIFLLILSEMHKKVESCNKNNKRTDEEYKSIKKSFKEVASGLHVLNGVGDEHPLSHSSWNEPEQILTEGIKNIDGGHKLESTFREYTNRILRYLRKKAFVVIFDDIDTATHQGKIILELIRKYFTNPNIIVILLGDVELYNLIVREMQWFKLNPETTFKYEKRNFEKLYESDIDTLVNQYMLKILKPENRINLLTIQNINDIKIKCLDSSKKCIEIDLDEYVSNIIKTYFMESFEHDYFKHYIKSQPIRIIMSIMKSSGYEKKQGSTIFLTSLVHILKNKLSNMYAYVELDRLLFAFTYVQDNRFNLLYSYIAKMNKLLNFSPKINLDFIPNTDKLDRNSLAILMSCHIVNGVNSIKDICDYFIQVCVPIDFNCHYEFKSNSFSIARLLNKDLRKEKNNKLYKGTIRISQEDIKNTKLDKYQRAIFNVLIGGLFTKNGLRHYISVWNIFGFIASMSSDKDINLQKLLQVKYFHLGNEEEQENTKNTNISFLQEQEYDTEDLQEISKFSKKEKIEISNRQLYSIFTRIEYAIKDIDNSPSEKLGEHFHRYIIAILNSFIVVVLEKEKDIKFNNAISFSDGENPIFKYNLHKLIGIKDKYKWLLDFIKQPFFQIFLYSLSKIYKQSEDIIYLNIINSPIEIDTTSLLTTNSRPNEKTNSIYKSYDMFDCLNHIYIGKKKLRLNYKEQRLLQDNLLNKNKKSYDILSKDPNIISSADCNIIYEEYKSTRRKIPNKKEVLELFKKFIDDDKR